jgi:hypothetical protein
MPISPASGDCKNRPIAVNAEFRIVMAHVKNVYSEDDSLLECYLTLCYSYYGRPLLSEPWYLIASLPERLTA